MALLLFKVSTLKGIVQKVKSINHYNYQKLINEYAETHEYLTVKGFHHHCKAAIMDAIEDGLLVKDPARIYRDTYIGEASKDRNRSR